MTGTDGGATAGSDRSALSAQAEALLSRVRFGSDGLVVVVAQQHGTREVLMVAWMDAAALRETLGTGRGTYWSRSRQQRWRKGDTSGHVQHVRAVQLDCDGDTVLLEVDQVGPACHTGERTCFDAERVAARPDGGVDAVSEPTTGPLDVPLGQTWPPLPEFRRMAAGSRVIPVVRRFLGDAETPVGLYRRLAGDRTGSFLLESAEHDGSWGRWSIVGVRSAAVLTSRGPGPDDGCWVGTPPAGVPLEGDPLEMLRETLRLLATPRVPGLPPLTSGLVGMLGWDVVHRWERLPRGSEDVLGLPELVLCLATDLVVVDHRDATLWLVANAVNHDGSDERVDEAWADAVARLDAMSADLAADAPSSVATGAVVPGAEPRSTATREQFHHMVEQGKQAIRDGEVFQVVVSQRFSVDTDADALALYRALRLTNPSPYMYLVRLEGPDGRRFDVVGSSPEALVTVEDRVAVSHPIAGTRPRSGDPVTDAERARDLLADPKERAEHLMLVDLARNDLGRVCEAGSVDVVEFMQIERFSHVLHIVSTVTGRLRDGVDQVDVLTATFPAGTLSGAPKVRAIELIDELEATRRGVYGGVVGYFDLAGDLDLAIAIRTGVLLEGTVHVQAGGGVVADSTPDGEYEESRTKSAAVLTAVQRAAGLRPLAGPTGTSGAPGAAGTPR